MPSDLSDEPSCGKCDWSHVRMLSVEDPRYSLAMFDPQYEFLLNLRWQYISEIADLNSYLWKGPRLRIVRHSLSPSRGILFETLTLEIPKFGLRCTRVQAPISTR